MKLMKTKISLTVLIMLVLITSLWAAIGDWHNYTYSDDSQGIACDSSHVWCITSGGLISYNSLTGDLTKYLNSDGLGDIDLKSITVDSAGSIFVGGSNAALTKIAADGTISVEEFVYTNETKYQILSLHADGEILWVGTEIGVAKFLIYHNGGEFQEVYADLGDLPSEMAVRAILTIGNYLWAGTDSGLAYIEKDNALPQNPDNWTTITRDENGLTNSLIKSMVAVSDTLMVGTTGGVFQLGSDSLWDYIGPSAITIFDLEYFNGILYAATSSGIYQRSAGVWSLLPTDSLITDDAVGVAIDSSGNIWGAFDKGALGKYDSSYWETFSIPGPVSNRIQHIAIDSSANIWMVHAIYGYSSREGVSKFDGTQWQNYNYQNSGIGINGAVYTKYDAAHDLMWFASWGDGLFSFDGDTTWINYDENNSPLRGIDGYPAYVPVPGVEVDDSGYVWAVNLGAVDPAVAMVVFDPDDSVWQSYYEDGEQISANDQTMVYTHDGVAYVCSENLSNIYRLDYGIATDSTDDTWLDPITSVEEVNDLLIDNYDKLFIVTTSGLTYYDFTLQDTVLVELPDEYLTTVNCIAMDGLGYKWVGTDSGVVVLTGKFDQYTSSDSLWKDGFKTSNSFLLDNTVLSIAINRENGLVYIGTTKGLSIYESGFIAPSPDLDNMAAYPNPVDAKEADAEVNFLRVPADAEIYIYTVSGDLIRHLVYEETNSWDLRNEEGGRVAAGIYIFYVRSGDNSGTGKLAVIR